MATLPIRSTSAFSHDQMVDYLLTTEIPLRLACNGGNGFPLVASHWFEYRDGALLLAIHQGARVATLLEQNPLCGFEIAADTMPYRGVRGQGTAILTRVDAGEQLERLICRYMGATDSPLARWLLSRADEEYLVKITPSWLASWDFSERMSQR
jgi:nitroimidazol reductase NimA-like FMN-containing flavoprotein (pyridoxamine 5'-phosphate oxidase superfamily)